MPLPLKYLGLIESGTPPENLVTLGCLRPRKIFVYNSLTAKNEPLYVDCGHCIRCKDQRREEWASRMVLHADSRPWAYRYFITLTYGSYNLNNYTHHPFKHDWLETFPVEDTYNSKGLKRWTPSLLVSTHFTKFMKRLRFSIPDHKISYCVAGELGGSFGRPHFHAILYSDKPITRENVCSAWSFDCYRKNAKEVSRYCGSKCDNKRRFQFLIGRVDFNDLNMNGTCDFASTKNPSEVGKINAKNCFSYVAKYCVKDNSDMNEFAIQRYRIVFNQLQNDIECIKNHFTSFPFVAPDKIIRDYEHLLCEEDYLLIHKQFESYLKEHKDDLIKRSSYLDNLPQFLVDYIINDLYNYKTCKKNGKTYQKLTFSQFCKMYGSYFSTSRMYSIGKDYFLQNVHQIVAENYALRQYNGKTLVFPSYFYHLLEERKFGIKFRSRVESGISLCKGNLAVAYGYFEKLRSNPVFAYVPESTLFSAKAITPISRRDNRTAQYDCGLISAHEPSKGSLLDISLTYGNNKRVNYIYSPDLDQFIGLKYDRSCKQLHPVDYISRIDMCDFVMTQINLLGKQYPKVQKQSMDKLHLYEIMYGSTLPKLEIDKKFRDESYFKRINFVYSNPLEKINQEFDNFINNRNLQQRVYESEHFTKDNQ